MTDLAETPQWIDDIDPTIFEGDTVCPDQGDEVAVREWINRHLRRIATLQRERAVQVQVIANERARIDEYERESLGQLDRAIAHQRGPVEAWMHAQLERDSRTRSYRLPAGTVAARKLPDLIEVDPERVASILTNYPEFVRFKQELDKRALNDAVKDGLVVDGVAVTTGRVSITVTTDDPT